MFHLAEEGAAFNLAGFSWSEKTIIESTPSPATILATPMNCILKTWDYNMF